MTLRLAQRTEGVTQSEIRKMTLECNKVGGVNLSQGVCDLEVPPVLREALKQAVDEGFNTYTRFDGLDSLRHAIAGDLKARHGWQVDPEREVVVTVGSTGAFMAACLALLDPGDEVLLPEPYYGYHRNCLRALGGVAVPVRHQAPFDIDFDALRAALTPRTRAIMACTPANPTGKVWTRAELEALRDLAVEHDLFVFTDEIYEHFVYDGREHVPPATIEGLGERTITLSGFSKTYAITGWRIGYLVAPAQVAEKISYFVDIAYVCAPSVLQEAVARALAELPPSYYQQICADHLAKRDQVCDALRAADLPPHVPQGSYYVLADVSRLPGATSKERVMHLLRTSGVASVPGSAFFEDPRAGDHLARFCYAKKDADLQRACEALREMAG